jgi:hypothetical protein
MNLNKFLITENEVLEPVNSQFSGIFKKSSVPKELGVTKFLTPKSVPNNISMFQQRSFDYEDSLNRVSGSLDSYESEVLKRISHKYKDGNLTFKRWDGEEFEGIDNLTWWFQKLGWWYNQRDTLWLESIAFDKPCKSSSFATHSQFWFKPIAAQQLVTWITRSQVRCKSPSTQNHKETSWKTQKRRQTRNSERILALPNDQHDSTSHKIRETSQTEPSRRYLDFPPNESIPIWSSETGRNSNKAWRISELEGSSKEAAEDLISVPMLLLQENLPRKEQNESSLQKLSEPSIIERQRKQFISTLDVNRQGEENKQGDGDSIFPRSFLFRANVREAYAKVDNESRQYQHSSANYWQERRICPQNQPGHL